MPRERHYSSFPSYYFDLLDRYAGSAAGRYDFETRMDKKTANNRRRELYYFFSCLSKHAGIKSDPLAYKYWEIAKVVSILVSPEDEKGLCMLSIITNPLALEMRKAQ